ncbi:MAG: L-histidine N(alpha)-methyltransferase [Gaiellaceae bacterium]
MSVITPQIDVFLGAEDIEQALRHDVVAGLQTTPKRLPPKWFYDDRGSELFDAITRLPEYYLTRREREILYSEAVTLARITQADTLVELGSGTSEKTLLLLDGMSQQGTLQRYVPFDVSEATLRTAAHGIAERYPGVSVHAVVGDFSRHLGHLPEGGRRVVAFLGSTIGNLHPAERVGFLGALHTTLTSDDWLLLGTDLVKDQTRLEAAYNDVAGVTSAFNLNILSVLNRELGATFAPDEFEHVARFDTDNEWIEMLLRSRKGQTVRIEGVDLSVDFARDELMQTEISTKFRRDGAERELDAAGFSVERWWTDSHDDFALSLSRPR